MTSTDGGCFVDDSSSDEELEEDEEEEELLAASTLIFTPSSTFSPTVPLGVLSTSSPTASLDAFVHDGGRAWSG